MIRALEVKIKDKIYHFEVNLTKIPSLQYLSVS